MSEETLYSTEETIEEFNLENIHELGIRLKSIKEKLEHLKEPKPIEICACKYCNDGRMLQMFQEICSQHELNLQNYFKQLSDTAEQIVAQSGHDKIPFTGICTFAFEKARASLDTSFYDSMTDDQKAELHQKFQPLFRVKTTVNPDKEEIKKMINEGIEVDGFSINIPPNVFRIKF